MPKKRKSTETEGDGQTTRGSESLSLEEEDNTKREKLDLLSDTTLQDLPVELLECILVQVVAMEVKDLKFAKAVWKEKAGLVIGLSRLRTVCSQWSNILSTTSFQIKLHRVLDGTGQKFNLEILHESTIPFDVRAVTSLGDDTFLLNEHEVDSFRQDHFINVYNSNNLEEVKQVIPLPGKDPAFMTGCCLSNCVYIALNQRNSDSFSILRISKDAEHDQYVISPWESEHRRSVCMMSVTANGSVVIFDAYNDVVSIYYNGNGSLQREVILSSPLEDVHKYVGILLKSSGNIILAYVSNENYLTQLLEIDMTGIVVRRFESSYSEESIVTFADIHDRIMISPPFRKFELLDAEFNLLGVYILEQDVGKSIFLFDWHFDSERNEIVRIHRDRIQMTNHLTKYRLTEQ